MKTNILLSALMLSALRLCGDAVPRDSNFNNTPSYDNSRIEARFVVPVKDQTKVVHFIRDNNDPRVVTKAYLLHHVDAYEFRDYLRQMVQSKRVGNTALQQQYPGNSGNTATVSSAVLTTPATAQPGYAPALQLGSNTAVECLKYVDGTGLLLVSAEEYRFKDHPGGMGFDTLVEMLDKPQMGAFFGTQTFFYLPKFVPARNLMPLIQNVGMNITDVTELWQGSDLVAYDPDLNYLVFDVTNYSMNNIEKMLALYDVPIPQVRLKITVYEITKENDEKIGIDFQAWKNNDGMRFFSAGGRYRDNWGAMYNSTFSPHGSERTSFYNFNPRWNTRYLDFLAAKGKAKIAHSGELLIRNNTSASLNMQTQVFYFDTTTPAPGTTDDPDLGTGFYELVSEIARRMIPEEEDYPVAKANQQKTLVQSGFGFKMEISNASVNLDETNFTVNLTNSSLLGFESSGKPRISNSSATTVNVSLPHNKNQFVIGGLNKSTVEKSKSGIPWLCSIPWAGKLFSTQSSSVKHAELVVVGECTFEAVTSPAPQHGLHQKRTR